MNARFGLAPKTVPLQVYYISAGYQVGHRFYAYLRVRRSRRTNFKR